MRRLVLALTLAMLATSPTASASGPCEAALPPHGAGAVVVCDASGHALVLVVGDHQTAECPRGNGNIVVIVGDDNHVHCDPASRHVQENDCQGDLYAVEVIGEAHSCGVSVVVLGSGSGRIAIVGVGKAEGGTIAVVGHGCAAQSEEGVAIGVLSNSCGDPIVPPLRVRAR